MDPALTLNTGIVKRVTASPEMWALPRSHDSLGVVEPHLCLLPPDP